MTLPRLSLPFLFTGLVAVAAETPPAPAELVARHTHAFNYTATGLDGPGADLLRRETARSQFVLLGEEHMDHAVPVFAGGLFTLLHEAHGFRHLVVEQDPVAMEDILAPDLRGDPVKLGALARRLPSLFEFSSDEDLTFLAQVSRLVDGPDAIWGVEQTTGAIRYLEELAGLSPELAVRHQTLALLQAARAADPGPDYSVNWLANLQTPAALASLTDAFQAEPGSRAARLLAGLAKSAEVFGYYTRAEAGELVGLYNNTVREEVLKANFLRRYHAAAAGGRLPKALFKFGSNHLYRGRNPTQAFPIGNLAHELAIVNGREAYGVLVQPLGRDYIAYADLPAWMRPLLPAAEPAEPTLINLRELRRFQRLLREKLAPADIENFRTLINGYDAIVLLPGSRPSAKTLGVR